MKSAPLIVAALVRLAIAGYGSANASDSPAAGDPSTDHVFELPQSAGNAVGCCLDFDVGVRLSADS